MRSREIGWRNAGFGTKNQKKSFVGGEVVHYAGEELLFACDLANLGRADAGHGEKAPKPFAVPGNKGKRLNCQRFCRFRSH